MGFKCGIIGLPNVGKSTLFNALTESNKAEAANYPFATIEPNVGRVAVPDDRLNGATTYSYAWNIVNIAPSITVKIKPCFKLFLSFSNIAWCAHVTVVPDNNKIKVLINGISHGSKVLISAGGQTFPIASVGKRLAL